MRGARESGAGEGDGMAGSMLQDGLSSVVCGTGPFGGKALTRPRRMHTVCSPKSGTASAADTTESHPNYGLQVVLWK